MTVNLRKVVKLIRETLYKSPFVNDLNKTLGIATERTRKQLLDNVINSPVLQELRTIQSQPVRPVPRRLLYWWQWYQELIGLSTVEKARQQVVLFQNKLMKCQEIRHDLRQQEFTINNKTREIYDELLRTSRSDPKYVSLTIMENKNLQEQNAISKQLSLVEAEEKDYIMHLRSAINEYQDAQTINTQKYKYLSILASMIVGITSFIISMVYNSRKQANLNYIISQIQEQNESTILSCFRSLENHVSNKLSNLEPQNIEPTNSNKWVSTGKYVTYAVCSLLILKGLFSLGS